MWISLNEQDSHPIYLQIINQVKEQVFKGSLKPGDELPSVRELADSLGVNMHTVRSAYLKLRDQGIVNLRLGRRAKIARLKPAAVTEAVEADFKKQIKELITDAFLTGFSPDDLLKLFTRQLEELKDYKKT